MQLPLTLLAIAAYAAAVVRLVMGLRHPPPPRSIDATAVVQTPRRRIALLLAALALTLQSIVTWNLASTPTGLALPFYTALSLSAVVIVGLHLLICLREPADYLGLLIYPLAAISLLLALQYRPDMSTLESGVRWHIVLSLLAYGLLVLAAVQAILLAIQRHQLTHHHPGGFMRALPPFERTEALMFNLLSAGFILLTLSLLTGFIELDNLFAQHLVHKTVLSSLAWLVFALLLYGRWRYGLTGRRAVQGVLGGLLVLVLAYFGSKWVLEILLARGA